MCGRYSLAVADPFDLRGRFPVGEQVALRRRYNVAPGDEILAVTTTRDGVPRGELLRWGLVPPWAKDPGVGLKTINARAETAAERPVYREAFRRFRCLILADGFYEWQRGEDGRKHAFHVTRADGEPFAFAGLWSRWRSPDGELSVRSATIITRPAVERLASLHDRMPVILAPEQEQAWLAPGQPPEALHELLGSLPGELLEARPVGAAVNDARYDGPECLAPPAPAEPAAQASLF